MVRAQHKKICLLNARQKEILQTQQSILDKVDAIHQLFLSRGDEQEKVGQLIDFIWIESIVRSIILSLFLLLHIN